MPKKTKKKSSGGAVLLKKYGPNYFRELALKGCKRRKEAMKLLLEKEKRSKK